MKLEDQIVSLELAKKLKEVGYPQEGLWWWNINEIISSPRLNFYTIIAKEGQDDFIVAPTVAELGDRLKNITLVSFFPYYIKNKNVWHTGFKESNINDNTEANARAKMWLYLKENKLAKESER